MASSAWICNCRNVYNNSYFQLQLIGVMAIIASVFGISYGALAFQLVHSTSGLFNQSRLNSLHFGSWWCGVPLFIAGATAILIKHRDRSWSRRRLFCCIQISIVALLTSLVGTILDSVGAVAYSQLKACSNANNSNLSGDSDFFVQAETCYMVSHWFQPSSGVCYCAAATSCAVVSYNSMDCSFLLESYPLRLRDSAITSGVCLLVAIVLSICSCLAGHRERMATLGRTSPSSSFSTPPLFEGGSSSLQLQEQGEEVKSGPNNSTTVSGIEMVDSGSHLSTTKG